MPAIPHWHKRIPQIRATLSGSGSPLLDRPAIEKLFRLKPRRAQSLMRACGGTLIGRSAVVSPQDLLTYLDTLEEKLTPLARERRSGVLVELGKEAASKVPWLPLPSPGPVGAELPPGVALEAGGRLVIDYASAGELLDRKSVV